MGGFLIGMQCTKCGEEDKLNTGVSELWFIVPDTNSLLFEFIRDKREQKLIEHLIKEENGKLVGVPREDIYECQFCETLHSRLHYEIQYGNNLIYTKQYTCEKCCGQLVLVGDKENFLDYKCKKCNEKSLIPMGDRGIILHWD